MTDANDSARERMLKLLALAQQGVGGERDNARRFLDKMLAKHGMTEADLTGEQAPRRFTFTYTSATDKDLLVQVICKALKLRKPPVWRRRGAKSLMVDMTPAQHLETEVMLSVYRPALAKHMEAALIAFIVKNRITSGQATPDDELDDTPPSYDEAAAAAMAAITPVTPLHKQIGR